MEVKVAHWGEIKRYLEGRLETLQVQLEQAEGETFYRLQGRVSQVRELLRLPETLSIVLGEPDAKA